MLCAYLQAKILVVILIEIANVYCIIAIYTHGVIDTRVNYLSMPLIPLLVWLQACGRFGHIARMCPTAGNATGGGASQYTPVQRPAQYAPRSAAEGPVKCFRCGGLNHMSRFVVFCPSYSYLA